jgi:precorrin-3B synthase
MQSGDGLVVRIRPRGGRLTPTQARAIATLSQTHGNGLIDLSSRANVQLRGVTDASHPALIEGLRALDLIDDTPNAESLRNIIVTPFWADDATQTIATQLTAALAAKAPALPGKFGFVIDTAATPTLRDVSADIWIETGSDGLLLVPAGSATGLPVTAETAVPKALALAQWFIDQGGVTDGRGRMQALLQRIGPPDYFTAPRLPAAAQPKPGTHPLGQLIAFEFGQMQAETLAGLATLGPIRVTPWRMLLIENLQTPPNMPGVITSDDPMLNVIACTGAPGCLQAHAATRPLARALAPHLTQTLHISGCAKGCAHPTAALTLTATPAGFDLIRHGAASGAAERHLLSAAQLIQHPDLLSKAPA